MRIKINGEEVVLNNKEIKSAKKVILNFLDTIKEKSEEERQPTYYFTLLVVMNILSQEMIDEFDPKTLETVLRLIEEAR